MNDFTSNSHEPYANDAAFEADHGPGAAGDIYWNTTEKLIREHNGTAWQNDKTSFETQTDSTTTGASQDITPNTVAQIIQFTNNSLTSIRSIVPTIQKVIFFVNGQTSQAITLKNEDTSATAANRIVTGTGADFSIAAGQMVGLVYETGGSRWRLAGAASSGGSGTDGINLITSPSTATGWTATGTVFAAPVTTTTSADLPLEGATNSAIKFVATNSGTEATNYNSFPVTTSAAMNGTLQVDLFIRPGTGFATSEWTISVYQGSTRQALRNDSSSISYLPNGIVRYTTAFDALASTAYTLRFARTSGTGSATLNVCNVFLGWPFVSSIASIGKDIPSSPTTSLTNTTMSARYQQVGNKAKFHLQFAFTNTPGAGNLILSHAQLLAGTGLTVDTSLAASADTLSNGSWHGIDTGTQNYGGAAYLNTTQLVLVDESGTGVLTTTSAWSVSTGDYITVDIDVPIAEWAGSVSTGPAPAEEFASNDGSGGTSANTQYATGSVSGGSFFVGTNSATVTAGEVTDYVVNFQYPIQSDDHLSIEILNPSSTNEWVPIEYCGNNIVQLYRSQNASYGMGIKPRSSTSVWVSLGNGGRLASGAFGAAGAGWSSATTYKWRVRKTKKASLPYANAGTDGSAGLYKAGQAPGLTTGVAIGSGYVGEEKTQSRLRSAAPSIATATVANVTASPLTLTPGTWEISAEVGYTPVTPVTSTAIAGAISRTSATMPSADTLAVPNSSGERRSAMTTNLGTFDASVSVPACRVSISANTDFYLIGRADFSAGTVNVYGSIRAVRIA